jgi:hypothetical protein
VRLAVATLLALTACAADHPTPATWRDPTDFCGMPASACGKSLVDEQGHVHVVVCGPRPECIEGSTVQHGAEPGDICGCRRAFPSPLAPLVWVCPDPG